MTELIDILIVGAGAAGLMAGIWAGRTAPHHASVTILDGAAKPGAKILVSGGGRCNVTHDAVTPEAYAGSSRNAIKKVLRRFDVPQTIDFFRDLGVSLKREDTGKFFPTTDSARTVLNALLSGAAQAGVTIAHPRRVESILREGNLFVVRGMWGEYHARRVILATGGRSLPKTGSDGHGYALAQALGHSLTRYIFPALVPLTLPADHFIRRLSGITLPATLDLWSGTGKKLASFTESTLCTHFGLSGPSVLDMSRYYTEAKRADPDSALRMNWLPSYTFEALDAELQNLGKTSLLRYFSRGLPERLIRELCDFAGVDSAQTGETLTREMRQRVARAVTQLSLPISGDRGYNYAEVTAGGVPLAEIRLESMESRLCPGLHLCGELCDVDGRIGGYNFQWAWASGYLAGSAAASLRFEDGA